MTALKSQPSALKAALAPCVRLPRLLTTLTALAKGLVVARPRDNPPRVPRICQLKPSCLSTPRATSAMRTRRLTWLGASTLSRLMTASLSPAMRTARRRTSSAIEADLTTPSITRVSSMLVTSTSLRGSSLRMASRRRLRLRFTLMATLARMFSLSSTA